MAEKFTTDNKELNKYVLRMMETVNKIDLDEKIKYYAYLTRMLLLNTIDDALFHKLSQVLLNCTLYELEFINSHSEHSRFEYDLTVAALKNTMLVRQDKDCDTTLYMFTDLAKTLKTYSLCCDDSVLKPRKTLQDVLAFDDTASASAHEVDEMLKDVFNN